MVVLELLSQVRIFGVTQSKYTAITCIWRRGAYVNLSENMKHSLTQSMDYLVNATLTTRNICNMYVSWYLNQITTIIWMDKIYYKCIFCFSKLIVHIVLLTKTKHKEQKPTNISWPGWTCHQNNFFRAIPSSICEIRSPCLKNII